MEQNDYSNFGRGSPKEFFCVMILKSGLWPRRRCNLKFFLFLALAAILFSAANDFSNFGRGLPKEYFCEIILKSGHWPRCRLKVFLFVALAASLFSGTE